MESKFVALIPARKDSKRIPNKNVKRLDQKPLIVHTIQAAKKVNTIKEIVISTDDERIQRMSAIYNVNYIERPKHLAGDNSTTESAILHALKYIKADYIILLQPTSPLRVARHIRAAIKLFLKENADSLVSVCKVQHYYLTGEYKRGRYVLDYDKRPFSHDMPVKYRENGAIYIFKTKLFKKTKNRLCGKIVAYEMNEVSSLDIDDDDDLKLAAKLIRCKSEL